MNSSEFTYWLKGFLTATDLLPVTTQQEAWKLIKEELAKVTNSNSNSNSKSSISLTNTTYDPSLTQLQNGSYITTSNTETKRQKVL